jgi:hypothetical protein
MVHVEDVDRTVAFYSHLGFACASRFSSASGVTNWASLTSGTAKLFLARASGPILASQQAVLLYLYSQDVRGLRLHLLSQGLSDAGAPPGETPDPRFDGEPERSVVFQIVPRFYMPRGELRVHDPDGYVLLVGQLD